jgi:hypothetical protein
MKATISGGPSAYKNVIIRFTSDDGPIQPPTPVDCASSTIGLASDVAHSIIMTVGGSDMVIRFSELKLLFTVSDSVNCPIATLSID